MHDERRRPPPDAADTGPWSPPEPESGTVRRSRTQNDITSALTAAPVDDLTRPEVHLPVDVPPDDLTEAHSVYAGGDEDSISLPHEAPFGAHQQPDAFELDVAPWAPPAESADATRVMPSRPSQPPGSVTRVRTRTIAVEEDPTSGWSLPEPRTLRATPSTPPSVIVATASSPPSVMVSPSLAPPPGEGWTQPIGPSWPSTPPMPSGYPPSPPPAMVRGTVEMNLQVMQGVPTPVPMAPRAPVPLRASSPPSARRVSAGVWILVLLGLLSCAAMLAYGRLRG